MDHYKISIPCNREDAETINARLDVDNQWTYSDNPPTIVTREIVEFDDQQWMIDIYFNKEPHASIYHHITELLGREIDANISAEKFVDEDWVTISQDGLKAITLGSFHIHNSQQQPMDGKINIEISAGQAFGTGHHHTTSGCLNMLDNLRRKGKHFRNIADIGTGTGLLAFAAKRLWPDSEIIASDSDPVAIDFAIQAAHDNHIPTGIESGEILMLCASGTDHINIKRRAPYDLIIANILAGPLIELAPAFHQILAKDGLLILAGLLDSQIQQVVDAYQNISMQLVEKNMESHWPILIFKKTDAYIKDPAIKITGRTSQKEGDYGEW